MNVQSKSLFSYSNFVLAVSGAVGSVVGMVTFYPLDTVRSRLQLEEKRKAKNTFTMLLELAREEGFHTLYRGVVPVLQSLCISNFIYFYAFHGLRAVSKKDNTGKDLLLASIAGVINVLLTTPLWMVNTRMKMSGVQGQRFAYNGLIDGLLRVAREEGLGALWRGTGASLLLVSNPALHMTLYQAMRRWDGAGAELGAAHYFAMSAISKALATLTTYPLQLAQTKLRHGHSHADLSPDASTLQVLMYIIRREGFQGLFKGMEAKLLQTILTAALMFMLYEKIAAFVFRILH